MLVVVDQRHRDVAVDGPTEGVAPPGGRPGPSAPPTWPTRWPYDRKGTRGVEVDALRRAVDDAQSVAIGLTADSQFLNQVEGHGNGDRFQRRARRPRAPWACRRRRRRSRSPMPPIPYWRNCNGRSGGMACSGFSFVVPERCAGSTSGEGSGSQCNGHGCRSARPQPLVPLTSRARCR